MENLTITIPNAILLGEVASLLKEGKQVLLLTKGTSMLPLIVGERDSVRLARLDKVEVNDIVLVCLAGERYILHRVIAIDGQSLTLMGDGNLKGVEHCTLDEVCGTAVALVKPDGTEIDLRSASSIRRAKIWRNLLPLRRILLGAYKRTFLKARQ